MRQHIFAAVFLFAVLFNGGTARAINVLECSYPFCVDCVPCCTTTSVFQITQNLFDIYRGNFIMSSFYTGTVSPTFQRFADGFRNGELFKAATFGTFMDASTLVDTQRDVQVLSTKTLQNYTPSEQICRFGTLSRSLSASEARVDANKLVLSEVGLSRNLGTMSNIASAGRGLDNESRIRMFVEKFCDLNDSNSGLTEICQIATPVADLNHNRDVDFNRTLDDKLTINADFTNATWTQEESNTIGLAHYLYGHRQPAKRISYSELNESSGTAGLYSEYRSVTARRAAAQNSYNTLAAMKAAGSGASDDYMRAVLTQLGLPTADANRYLQAQNSTDPAVNASYYAQMDILAKKLYQDPAFFAGLMDSKTNVRRTSAAIQGVGLMQGRDMYRSMERSEMLLGLLVQLEARKMAANNRKPKGK
jgi:hypothetical protein